MTMPSSPRALLPAVFAVALLSACSAPTPTQTSATETASVTKTPEATVGEPAAKAGSAPITAVIPGNLTALGTEPFWSAKIDSDTLTYSTPESPDGVTMPVERSDQSDQTSFTAKLDDKTLVLEVKRETCSDGMSDAVYPMTVALSIDGDPQQGCAR